MLFHELLSKAKDLTIGLTDQDVSFLLPDYRWILQHSDLKPEDVTDFEGLTWDIVYEALKLDVKAFNAVKEKKTELINRVMSAIDQQYTPAEIEIQNNLFHDFAEYMKSKNKDNEKIINIKDFQNEQE